MPCGATQDWWVMVERSDRIWFTGEGTVKPLQYSCLEPHAQYEKVPQSCPTLCNPMDRSTPGFPVRHQLLELAQAHVLPVGDAMIQWCKNNSNQTDSICDYMKISEAKRASLIACTNQGRWERKGNIHASRVLGRKCVFKRMYNFTAALNISSIWGMLLGFSFSYRDSIILCKFSLQLLCVCVCVCVCVEGVTEKTK